MDDEFDELFRDRKAVKDLHKDLETAVPKQSGQRSNADDVIDAIGPKTRRSQKTICPKCGSEEFSKRKPISGEVILRCRGCGFKLVKPSNVRQRMVVTKVKALPTSGPYYSQKPKSSTTKIDKNTPKYRRKGKPFKKGDE